MTSRTTGYLVLSNQSSNMDSFGRLRVSDVNTLMDYAPDFGKNPNKMDEVLVYGGVVGGSGITGASCVENIVASTIDMNVGLNSVGGTAIRQSFEYVPYQPGKSRLMKFSGVIATSSVPYTVSRIGCFDSGAQKISSVSSLSGLTGASLGNGLFFEYDGSSSTIYVVERLNDVDTKTPQTSWNIDSFNGLGPSQLTITNWNVAMIYVIDQEWLGVGRVRYGILINGVCYYCHYSEHSGVYNTVTPSSSSIMSPYTRTAKLPIRYEIGTTGTTQCNTMRMISSSVLLEGNYTLNGTIFAIGSDTTQFHNDK